MRKLKEAKVILAVLTPIFCNSEYLFHFHRANDGRAFLAVDLLPTAIELCPPMFASLHREQFWEDLGGGLSRQITPSYKNPAYVKKVDGVATQIINSLQESEGLSWTSGEKASSPLLSKLASETEIWGPKKKPVREAEIKSAAALGVVGFYVLFLVMIWAFYSELPPARPSVGRNPYSLLFTLAVAASILFLFQSIYLYEWLCDYASRYTGSRAHEIILAASKSPIVLLRSFADEKRISHEERSLATVVGGAGPFVACGRPGETVPQLGAARFYLPPDDWQQPIRDLLGDASIVIMAAGRTSGVTWEIIQCRQVVEPRRFLVFVPNSRRTYSIFKSEVESQTDIKLPDFPKVEDFSAFDGVVGRMIGLDKIAGSWRGFIQFDPEWRGYWKSFSRPLGWNFAELELGRGRVLEAKFARALRAKFEELSLSVKDHDIENVDPMTRLWRVGRLFLSMALPLMVLFIFGRAAGHF